MNYSAFDAPKVGAAQEVMREKRFLKQVFLMEEILDHLYEELVLGRKVPKEVHLQRLIDLFSLLTRIKNQMIFLHRHHIQNK